MTKEAHLNWFTPEALKVSCDLSAGKVKHNITSFKKEVDIMLVRWIGRMDLEDKLDGFKTFTFISDFYQSANKLDFFLTTLLLLNDYGSHVVCQ